jgi:hypothetical protein
MTASKMTVKVFSPLYEAFSRQLLQLPIKRDGFLNHVLRAEVARLDTAMEGKRNSPEARRYISRQLKKLGTITVSLAVDAETVAKLDHAVEKANLVRDAFVNRLIALLRSSDKLLAHLDLPKEDKGRYEGVSYGLPPTSPMKRLEEAFLDPLDVLHILCEARYETNLYLVPFQPDAFACYLDDVCVPGTKAHHELVGESLDAFAF